MLARVPVLAMALCMSVTSLCSIKRDEQINLDWKFRSRFPRERGNFMGTGFAWDQIQMTAKVGARRRCGRLPN